MKIAHEAGKALAVTCGYCDFLFLKMCDEDLAPLLRQHPHAAKQSGFDNPPRLIDGHRLLGGGLDDEPPSPRADMDDATCFQPHHRLPYPRT
ncbi:hypothetical protein D3C78_1838820 [compost metagenome]